MYVAHEGVLDSYDRDDDRVQVTFVNKAGFYWIYPELEEQVRDLRRCMTSGEAVEITYDPADLRIGDVKVM